MDLKVKDFESALKTLGSGIQQPIQYLDLPRVQYGGSMLLPESGLEQDRLDLVQRFLQRLL